MRIGYLNAEAVKHLAGCGPAHELTLEPAKMLGGLRVVHTGDAGMPHTVIVPEAVVEREYDACPAVATAVRRICHGEEVETVEARALALLDRCLPLLDCVPFDGPDGMSMRAAKMRQEIHALLGEARNPR